MITRYRDIVLYLMIAVIMTYGGTFFIQNFVYADLDWIFNKPALCAVMLINSLLVYFIVEEQTEKKPLKYLISLLYIFSPLHLDVFYLPFEGQFIVAETLLLVAYLTFTKNKIWASTFLILISLFLNFKFIALVPLLMFSKNFSLKQKSLIAASAVAILFYLVPGFLRNAPYNKDHYLSLLYQFEQLFAPYNTSVFSVPVLVPDYYSVFSIILLPLILTGCLIWYSVKKFTYYRTIILLTSGSVIAQFIPVKYFTQYETHFYYFTPALNSLVLLTFLFIILLILKKNQGRVVFGTFVLIGLMWLGMNINLQTKMRSKIMAWEHSIGRLPEKINYEENIKYNFTKLLMQNSRIKEAEKIVLDSKNKFRTERWYTLHLQIASLDKNPALVEQILQEQNDLQIPINYNDNANYLP